VRWTKHGLLIAAPPPLPFGVSHAALPVVVTNEDGLEILFSSRDAQGSSHIARARASLDEGQLAIVAYDPEPVLSPGRLGGFDDSGVTTSCLVHAGERRFLYFTGWSLGRTVPFYFYVGCAVSDDEGRTFGKISPAPVLERNAVDPYLTASPWVLIEDGLWRMWYVSGTGWTVADGGPKHRYHIKYAESRDGLTWERGGRVCIDYRDDSEYAIARPCVVRDEDRYRMWFSARGDAYRIGYAESQDGLTWERRDEDAGIAVSADGWDSQMQEYPAVFDYRGRRLMLYNGDGYGATGIGWAELDRDEAEPA